MLFIISLFTPYIILFIYLLTTLYFLFIFSIKYGMFSRKISRLLYPFFQVTNYRIINALYLMFFIQLSYFILFISINSYYFSYVCHIFYYIQFITPLFSPKICYPLYFSVFCLRINFSKNFSSIKLFPHRIFYIFLINVFIGFFTAFFHGFNNII